MTKLPEETELLTNITTIDDEIIGQGEIQFIPTGSKHKDLAIAGMINDAPNACKALIKANVWDSVCSSTNPAGKAELEILHILNVPKDLTKIVLIKLKTLLIGRNNSIMQAFHNCIIEDVLKRINMSKLTPQIIKAQATPLEEDKKENKPLPSSVLNGSILTHPDGSTYTFGNRGRRPLWVLEWLSINPEPEM